jgi:hypothetical protein
VSKELNSKTRNFSHDLYKYGIVVICSVGREDAAMQNQKNTHVDGNFRQTILFELRK